MSSVGRGRSPGTYALDHRLETHMTTPAHPGRMLFVNIPVADLERSTAFFAGLGFSFNPMFADEPAACMLVGEHAFVMLLSRERFAQLAKLPIADPTTHTLALYCFSVASRDEVDAVGAAALAAGGPRRMTPRTTASCTRAASSTSTATAGRSCGWTRRRRRRPPSHSWPPCRTPVGLEHGDSQASPSHTEELYIAVAAPLRVATPLRTIEAEGCDAGRCWDDRGRLTAGSRRACRCRGRRDAAGW